MSNIYIEQDQLDDIQTVLATEGLDRSMLVQGCAGSGKTVLALYRAKYCQNNDDSYFLIVYTKVLKGFIQDAIRELDLDPDRVVHFHGWKNLENRHVNYLIVDEVQDFTKPQIDIFFQSFSKSIACFGDSAQSLYTGCLGINGILGEHQELKAENLQKNYRFPKKIARVAKYLQKDDVEDIYVSRCVNEGQQKPRLYKYDTYEEQIEYVVETVKTRKLKDVGILLPTNSQVRSVLSELNERGMKCEARYKSYDENGNELEVNTLDFSTTNPKIATYHSAKGCQFNDVFLPMCENEQMDDFFRNPLYVAFTRAMNNIYVLYTYNLPNYFSMVPKDLYLVRDQKVDVKF